MKFSFLLRPLIPTWRFFEDLGPFATLSYRVAPGEWVAFSRRPSTRSWKSLFLNPEGSLRLAEQTLVDQLVQHLPELGTRIVETVSYQLVVRLVKSRVPGPLPFQFKITLGSEDILEGMIE